MLPRTIILGAVTVDTGPMSALLGGETAAIRAVVDRVNASGGVCGRTIELRIRDSGWSADAGYQAIQDLSDEVFALAVNPDSRGLQRASEDGFLEMVGLPVIGTDGLLSNQFEDPYIWPVGPSNASAARVTADAQFDSGLRRPSIVLETDFGLGRAVADAYHGQWVRRTATGVPGYSATPTCQQRFCGVRPFSATYTSEINRLADACNDEPVCDAGMIALDPSSALGWMNGGGGAGGVADPSNGAGAAPPFLFNGDFARNCRTSCDEMRLWTALRPPIHPFRDEPAVAQYVEDLRAQSVDIDVINQNTQAAYVGALLTIHALRAASTMPGGLTRDNVAQALDSTSDWNSGLTVSPLSWSIGDHTAAKDLHAFDLRNGGNGPDYLYVEGSARSDPAAG